MTSLKIIEINFEYSHRKKIYLFTGIFSIYQIKKARKREIERAGVKDKERGRAGGGGDSECNR